MALEATGTLLFLANCQYVAFNLSSLTTLELTARVNEDMYATARVVFAHTSLEGLQVSFRCRSHSNTSILDIGRVSIPQRSMEAAVLFSSRCHDLMRDLFGQHLYERSNGDIDTYFTSRDRPLHHSMRYI